MLEERIGWKKSTTYTVLDKCIQKVFVERIEPNFICKAVIAKSEIQDAKIGDLIGSFFGNSKSEFIRAFFKEESLMKAEIDELEDIIDKLK